MADVSGGSKLACGFDANLDFPFDDAGWATFAREKRCSVTSYTDLDALTMAVQQRLFEVSYLPSSSCYFLREAPYKGLVSAMTPITKRAAQSSVLVVPAGSHMTSWQDLRGKRLGYINTYCTTSYFAPSILLGRDGIALKDFFHIIPVAPWQGQVDAVLDGRVDASMVYEDAWLAEPTNAERTVVLARMDNLPTPPFIVRSDMDAATSEALKQTLLGIHAKPGTQALYAGFAVYQDKLMQRLFADLAALPGMAHAA